jgi:tripartite-type tricarboxylate transporter receptor subunit TctC
MMKSVCALAALLASACLTPVASWAAEKAAATGAYPNKPIRLIVPFPPGGGTDIVSRTLQPALTAALGQQVLVDNRGGAQGITGISIAAKANPDGYTMVIAEAGAAAIAPAIQENLGFDVNKDLVAITTLAEQPYIMTVHLSVAARTLPEFIKLAQTKPGTLNYGSGSITQHVAQVLFFDAAKLKLTHVPYRGTGPAVAAIVGGEVQTTFAGLGVSVSQIKAGRIRALAVTTPARTRTLPDVATLDEQGFKGFSVRGWYAMLVPSATPQPITSQLHRVFNDMLSGGTTARQLSERGYEPIPMSMAESGKFIRSEIQRWGQAVKTAGIKSID